MEGYEFTSGLPMLGTLFQIAGCVVGFGSTPVGLAGIASALTDTGGLPWFVISTWKDEALWDDHKAARTSGSSVFLTRGTPLAEQESRRGSESAEP